MNALLKEKLSIVSPKPQTTRHRILGVVTEKDYQLIFSDTPGMLAPAYKLQNAMMDTVSRKKHYLHCRSLILLIVTDYECFFSVCTKNNVLIFYNCMYDNAGKRRCE